MTVQFPKPADVRVMKRQDGGAVVTHHQTAQQAVVSRHGDVWRIMFRGVPMEFPACREHHDICPWPVPECYSSAKHLREQCHDWHAPRAVVAAASLLNTQAAHIVANPPPKGSRIVRGEKPARRADPRGPA